jgi:hypothetical protein
VSELPEGNDRPDVLVREPLQKLAHRHLIVVREARS